MELKEMYQNAASKAFEVGIDAGNQDQLVAWIRENCRYAQENEFFLVLGIGCELADLQAQADLVGLRLQAQEMGYENEVHRAFTIASQKVKERKEQVR